jgi:hypothetical protein
MKVTPETASFVAGDVIVTTGGVRSVLMRFLSSQPPSKPAERASRALARHDHGLDARVTNSSWEGDLPP